MIILIKDNMAKYYEQDFAKWNPAFNDYTIYVGRFKDYCKFIGVEVELDLNILKSKVLEKDLDKKNLCYLFVLSSNAAYVRFPNKTDEVTFAFLEGVELVDLYSHDFVTVSDYIIKSIIE